MSDSYHDQIATMIGYMAKKPMSRTELQLFTGLQQSTVDKWIKAFRDKHLIYVAEYETDAMGRLRIQKYLFDPGKSDVPLAVFKQRIKERNQS